MRIGNVFADFFSLMAFGGIIYFCKREIQVIKSFLDEIAYGLSDSAKAFLIILLTDMFVGYHSPPWLGNNFRGALPDI